jgi:hypothetical protein
MRCRTKKRWLPGARRREYRKWSSATPLRDHDGFCNSLLEWPAALFQCGKTRRMTMKNPLDSIWGTIISGLILTAILYLAVKTYLM